MFETICRQKAAKLICFSNFFFNAILGQESLWLISSQWKPFQNSKNKACIGNTGRDLIITLKICHSAAQGTCIK